MRYATSREKVELLKQLKEEQAEQVRDNAIGSVVDQDKKGRTRVRYDLRSWIKSRLQEEGISMYEVTKYMGVQNDSMVSFLNGRIPCPLDRVEELMWILMPETYLVDDSDITILRGND